jgi:hypothetical protein
MEAEGKMFNKKNTILWLCVFAVFLSMPILAKTETISEKPYNVAITFANDTASEKSFTWYTKSAKALPTVLHVWEQGGIPISFNGTSERAGNVNIHKATATGLKPGTSYFYRCDDGEVGIFETGIIEEDFSFLYMTDPQSASESNFKRWQRTVCQAVGRMPDAAFFIVSGDLVDKGSSEDLWNQFFQYGKRLTNTKTIVPAIGNHDADKGFTAFKSHFSFPKNEAGLPDFVYSFDYGNARFMVLSTQFTPTKSARDFLNKQAEWLRNEVSANPKKWNIVVFHKSIYPSGPYYGKSDIAMIRDAWASVFDELDIDAVLSGHDHTFTKAFLYGGKTVDSVNKDTISFQKGKGTFYLIANSAGSKFYDVAGGATFPHLLRYAQPKKQMFTCVSVTEDSLKFETYAVKNDDENYLFDTLEIHK